MNQRINTFFFVSLLAFSLLFPTEAFAEKPAAPGQVNTACLPFLMEAVTASTSSAYAGTQVYVLSDPEAWLDVDAILERFFCAAAGAMKVDQARSSAPPTVTPEDAGVGYLAASRKPSSFAVAPDCPPVPVVNPYIGGRVYQDNNHDGLLDVGDFPVEGVTVTAYDASNAAVASTMSSADGDYLITSAALTAGTEYRVEFTGFPSFLETSIVNTTNSNTSVQFVTPDVCNIDLGLIDPYGYVDPSASSLVVTCFLEGDNVGNTDGTIVSMDYENPTGVVYESQGLTTGSTYGLAYSPQSELIFASAYYKRLTGFGPGTTGTIYAIDNPVDGTNSGAAFLDLNTLFGSNVAGNDDHDFVTLSTLVPTDILDGASMNLVGRRAFGDIDITNDGDTLWAVNLNDRSLYGIPLGNDPTNPVAPTNAADVEVIPIATNAQVLASLPGTPGANEIIPFALKYYRGALYVGLVTNGENNTNPANLNDPANLDNSNMFGVAYRYDIAGGTFTKVLEFPLNYNRGCGYVNSIGACSGPADWSPWTTTASLPRPARVPSFNGSRVEDQAHPQPIFADIEFDLAGNMLIGLRDRYGDQSVNQHVNADDMPISDQSGNDGANQTFNDSYGDMLRATPSGAAWTINIADFTDNSLSLADVGGACPDGEAFFSDDCFPSTPFMHEEVIMGGLAVVPGTNNFAVTSVDPDNNDFSSGLRWYESTTGALTDALVVIDQNSGGFTGKGGGLGDVELVGPPPPIEIGNRLWRDDDLDGIQDPGENGINGVRVELYAETAPGVFTLVASTITGTSGTQGDGAYLFSRDGAAGQTWESGFTEVEPFTNYEVRLTLTDVIAVETDIIDFTSSNASGNTTNSSREDLSDSDLVDNAGTAVISYRTGDNGFHNHTLDFGVITCVPPTANITAAAGNCDATGGISNTATITLTMVMNGDEAGISTGAIYGGPIYGNAVNMDVVSNTVTFTGLVHNTQYTVRVFNMANDCFEDFTITTPVQTVPMITLNDPADECINGGSDMNFTGSPLPGVGTMGVFTTTATAGFTDNADGTATLDVSAAGAGTYTVTYTYTDANDCVNSETVTVNILNVDCGAFPWGG